MNIPNSKYPRIIIVGGGFAGVNLAKTLANKPFQIVLLDQHNYHTFQPLLYQVSSAGLEPDSIAYPLRKIIKNHKHSFFRMAEVERIISEENKIVTSIGPLTYDHLVIATGTKTNFFGNKSIEVHSMPMKKVPQALDIRSLILQNLEAATIAESKTERQSFLDFVIVGGGPTGVELAGAIAELKNHIVPRDYPDLDASDMSIHLIEGSSRLLANMSENASHKAKQFLIELGVQIHLSVQVKNYDGLKVETNSDLIINSETLIWAAGVTGNPVHGLDAKVFSSRGQRYEVNQFNQVDGYSNIYALGDIALMRT
ncbi:MAG: FAD-dependent oxidoreductase, partial [Flavobacteriaceae bacterium]|nr:FAD-dependent oxidoreductase [Flavobacteriaceae bacterium]